MSLLKPQSSHPKFTKFIDATGLVGCCCNRVASLLVLIWVEKTIRIHVYAGFLKINAFDRLYYFFQNKGEDWEISLYVN